MPRTKPVIPVGTRYERLTICGTPHIDGKNTIYKCLCDCGNYSTVTASKFGVTKSCGCARADTSKSKATTHGASHTRLYNIWISMRSRCCNPNIKEFKYYGLRGISVCQEWNKSYEVFSEWAISNGYKYDLSIDRIDTNGPYSPDNCKWSSQTQQCRNRRTNRMVTAWNETKPLNAWVDDTRCNVKRTTLRSRLDKGWFPEIAISSPV